CTRDARLSLPETGLGLIPGVGGTQTLPRVVGLGHAASLLLAGTEISGADAARIGLAAAAVAPGRLEGTVRRLARRIASLDAALLRAVKECVVRGLDLPLADGLALERRQGRRLERRCGLGLGDG